MKLCRASGVAVVSFALSALFPLSVFAVTQKPTCVISSPPGAIAPGTQTRLIWYTEFATKAVISHGIGEVNVPTGYIDVHPSVSTMYTMTAMNALGSNTCSSIITVHQNTPSLLYYSQPTYQPIVFTPVTYVPVMPYTHPGTVVYDEWYEDYPSPHAVRTYDTYETYDEWTVPGNSGRYDFWADYTRGPSTGPSLFGEAYVPNNPPPGTPYSQVTEEILPSGLTRYTLERCVDEDCVPVNRGFVDPDSSERITSGSVAGRSPPEETEEDKNEPSPGQYYVGDFETTNEHGVTTVFSHHCWAGTSDDECEEKPFEVNQFRDPDNEPTHPDAWNLPEHPYSDYGLQATPAVDTTVPAPSDD